LGSAHPRHFLEHVARKKAAAWLEALQSSSCCRREASAAEDSKGKWRGVEEDEGEGEVPMGGSFCV